MQLLGFKCNFLQLLGFKWILRVSRFSGGSKTFNRLGWREFNAMPLHASYALWAASLREYCTMPMLNNWAPTRDVRVRGL